MSDFTTSLINVPGSSIIPVSSPQITIPLPPSGESSTFTLTFDAAISSPTVPANLLPPGANWSSPNLTVNSSFTSGTITIQWAGGNSTSFGIGVASGANASATTTNLTVNADGSFLVAALESGVTMTGPTPVVTGIPTGGQVQLTGPVFFVTSMPTPPPTPTQYSFVVTGATGTITAGPGLSVNGSTVSVSNWSALSNSVVTVPFGTGNSTFVVAKSTRPSASGGQTNLTMNTDGWLVTALATNAYLAGIDLEYQTTEPGQYGFSFDAAGLSFNGFSWPGGTAPGFITTGTGSSFTDTNTEGVTDSTPFTIGTSAGSIDPTIMNNPDT
jgi:hypothetical protein